MKWIRNCLANLTWRTLRTCFEFPIRHISWINWNPECKHISFIHILKNPTKIYIFLHVSKSQYFFFNLNCSNLLDMKNLQEQVWKTFYYQELFWPGVRKNCCSDRENFLKFEAEGREFAKKNQINSFKQRKVNTICKT